MFGNIGVVGDDLNLLQVFLEIFNIEISHFVDKWSSVNVQAIRYQLYQIICK